MQPDMLHKLANLHPSLKNVSTVVRQLELTLVGIETPIYARIWLTSDLDDPFQIEFSHHIKTPVQSDAYHPSRPTASTEDEAIQQAITIVCRFADDAIRNDHTPAPEWLVANPKWTVTA